MIERLHTTRENWNYLQIFKMKKREETQNGNAEWEEGAREDFYYISEYLKVNYFIFLPIYLSRSLRLCLFIFPSVD